MGFWSGVCSFVSSVGSAIGSALSGACSVVASALSVLSSPLAQAVVVGIQIVANLLGIGTEEDKPEEIGMKVCRGEKKFEDFESSEEYFKYLDGIQLGDDDLEELENPTKKAEYSVIGTTAYMQGINEKYGMNVPIDSYIRMVSMGIEKAEELKEILDTYKQKEVEPNIEEAIKCELAPSESKDIIGTLREGIKKLEKSSEIMDRLDKMLDEM